MDKKDKIEEPFDPQQTPAPPQIIDPTDRENAIHVGKQKTASTDQKEGEEKTDRSPKKSKK